MIVSALIGPDGYTEPIFVIPRRVQAAPASPIVGSWMLLLHRDIYPLDWDAIAFAVKDANGWECQECGLACRRPDEPYDTPLRTLTVAHYDHDYEAAEVFVVALCTRCHFRHDAPFGWAARRRHARLRQARAGQLEMFEEGKAA